MLIKPDADGFNFKTTLTSLGVTGATEKTCEKRAERAIAQE